MKKQKIILMLILILTGLSSFAQYSNDDILEMTMEQDTLHVITTD